MKTIRDLDVKNKRVLVRTDFNVPLDGQGNVLDDFRIKQTLPTIEYLIKQGAKVILMSHLGRPEGKIVPELRLTPIQEKLTELLDLSVVKSADCIGPDAEKWTLEMQPGEVLLLENLRFHKEEELNDDGFARELAKLGDIYINDAFGACHRSHASVSAITRHLPSAAGFLLEKEVLCLTRLSINPKKPLIAIIGGKKVEDKIKLIDKISETADLVIISGLLNKAIIGQKIQLKNPQKIITPIDEIGGGKDIGIESEKLFREKIFTAKMIFWNGPFGAIEQEEFAGGTRAIAKAIIDSCAFSVIGGGETVEFIDRLGLTEKFSHVSTGGGAMLEFLSGELLPGLEVLK